jgi:restriction system protein
MDEEVSLTEYKKVWSLNIIQSIDWRKLEELSFAYFLERGIPAKASSRRVDGGIDIKLYQDISSTPKSVVRCKSGNIKCISRKEIHGFSWIMSFEKIAKGIYITSGEFTNDAKEFAKSNGITLITGKMLLMMISRLPEESQKQLLGLVI